MPVDGSSSSLITSGEPWCCTIQTNLVSRFRIGQEEGEKDQSLGNTIAPSDVRKAMLDAEILRLWVASVDSSNDVRISMDILSQSV